MLTLFLIQLLPLPFLLWLGLAPMRAPLARAAQASAAGSVLLAALLVGVSPAWWLPHLNVAAFVLALAAALRRRRGRTGIAGWIAAAVAMAFTGAALILVVQALAGRAPPPGPVADLAFPLRGGGFQVANGGFAPLINPHLRTLARATERQRAYYGQSYGIDLIAFGPLGFAAQGIEPRDPRRWAVFGAPIHAPCSGEIVRAGDGLPDMPVPQMDPAHMVGNHVLLRCGTVDILLAHMTPGSVAVAAGDRVREGDVLGKVGNSGNSSAPHLHIHAQTPGSDDAPFSGDPLPMRFGGKFPVRGDRM